ncbi:hypothetical protein ACFOW4_16290 [Micromonospora sp. GCM10011542]|uniref:hypothetical protein n=1 Tax=Micromonospora sp. GCM10011542 TaxID=3317337 RepID=UPI003607F150
MVRDVTVHVAYRPDRSMRVVVLGPEEPVEAGTTHLTAEVGPIAAAGVRAVYGAEPVSVHLRLDRPPWLERGMIVRLTPEDTDGMTHPYGQVMGFLPVGGVIVVHPEASAGIYPPELLTPMDPTHVPPDTLADIVRKTDCPARQP